MHVYKNMKILKKGHLSIYDDSPWIPGVWREEPNAPINGESCGVGYHSIICGDPLKAPVFAWPCEVWEDEVEGECGRDEIKARYRRQRIIKEITDQFPAIVAVNRFITETIPAVKWFVPQPPEEWMIVEEFDSIDTAWNAAWDSPWNTTFFSIWDSVPYHDFQKLTLKAPARAAEVIARDAITHVIESIIKENVGHDLFIRVAAAGYIYTLLGYDYKFDLTWHYRWWRAWELGYYPIRQEGDKLVVGKIKEQNEHNLSD